MSKILEVSTRTIKRHIKEMNNISILAVDIVDIGRYYDIKDNSIIFHIDVNSAYLSWSALRELQNGSKLICARFHPL